MILTNILVSLTPMVFSNIILLLLLVLLPLLLLLLLDDQAAIRAQRRGWRHPLIMPYSKFRSTWNVFMLLLMI